MAALTNEQIIEAIGEKTILELSELIKAMEEKFGVTAAAPVAVVAGGAAGGGAAEEEKTEFTVTLKGLSDPGKKIGVIKEVRNVIPGLGLKEAKELVEGAPKVLKEDVSKEEAAKIKEAITAAGGEVEIA
ncbi:MULTISPECIES: 50S ribosomal protein L7/L12 [Treponema]|mgnify:FL=1|jgi:ribosomal protein L7/L12|uniref:Large ribosomal subunit protein bL12 n=5 Tax=Treponema denticola TaxID=158 RepID=RL7_TREDE|nr:MULTISPECIES: 50S ribosomal protein L7/L12 [Treponema]Q73JJ6.1 RecName: Full=Large ribosomal subunit protein bL12; AltName: Full=50S ribosomal protein L7/L12 [Treponema denticola ATCC 35405]MCL6332225.1 50S ribosomal protein L7/L12 [Pectobacterium carotovorum subsp. carotovorum]AAS12940.1 ribosomal protein L7/L12 [Treponema denticola ATCC 35405]EGC78038.1 50S ribosomal protein L7/L12 [Treponema denticola F0402]EMB23690.1 50S ribosomal protein L7/L12 [Treponema denticola OTK]EMB24662.1 50S 